MFVDEGIHCYASMNTVYMISEKLEKCTWMVDLLGSAGHLHKAKNMIKLMLCNPDVVVWMTLLHTCRIHGNVEMGEDIAKGVLKLEPENSADFLLLSNMYAAAANRDPMRMLNGRQSKEVLKKQPITCGLGSFSFWVSGVHLHLFGIVHATCLHENS